MNNKTKITIIGVGALLLVPTLGYSIPAILRLFRELPVLWQLGIFAGLITAGIGLAVIAGVYFLKALTFLEATVGTIVVGLGDAGKGILSDIACFPPTFKALWCYVKATTVWVIAKPCDACPEHVRDRVKAVVRYGMRVIFLLSPNGHARFDATEAMAGNDTDAMAQIMGKVRGQGNRALMLVVASFGFSGVSRLIAWGETLFRQASTSIVFILGQKKQPRFPPEEAVCRMVKEMKQAQLSQLILSENVDQDQNESLRCLFATLAAIPATTVSMSENDRGTTGLEDLAKLNDQRWRGIYAHGHLTHVAGLSGVESFLSRILEGGYHARFSKQITFTDQSRRRWAAAVGNAKTLVALRRAFTGRPDLVDICFVGRVDNRLQGTQIALFAELFEADLEGTIWQGISDIRASRPAVVVGNNGHSPEANDELVTAGVICEGGES